MAKYGHFNMNRSKRFLLTAISTTLSLGLLSALNPTNIGTDLFSQPALAQPSETELRTDGWAEYSNSRVSVWMPEYFRLVEPSAIELFIQQLDYFIPNVGMHRQGSSILGVFNPFPGDSPTAANVMIVPYDLNCNRTMTVFLEERIKAIADDALYMVVTDSDVFTVDNYQVGRYFVDNFINQQYEQQVVYLVKDGLTLYEIYYTAYAGLFDEWLPIFERSFLTFRWDS